MVLIEEKKTKKIPGETSLFVSFQYDAQIVSEIKTLSLAIYDKKTSTWELPLTLLSELIDKLSILSDIKLVCLKDKEEKLDTVYKLSKSKTKPFEYQEQGIQYGLNHDAWLLLDAPGLGKTLQIIILAAELKKREKLKHCLVICGVNTLKTNWKKEIEKHSDLSCVILGEKINSKGNISYGSIKDRLDQLKSNIKEFFVITNIETLRDDKILKELQSGKNEFDMIVVDEIHKCKSCTSIQSKHLLKLNNIKYRIGLTGTLLLNNPLDTYIPLKWIGADRATYSNFKYYYCVYGGRFNNELLGFKNIKYLKQQIDKYSLRRTKDLLDLPPKNIIVEYVDMSERQQAFYNNIKQGIVAEVDKVHISTASILGMVSRLRQATACPSILTTEPIESSKIVRACDLVDQILSQENKVVIFSTFKDTLNELEKKLKNYNPLVCTGDVKDNIISNNIELFQNDDTHRVLLATWQKMGTGVTLTAASSMIFIDTPWTDAQFTQCCDRIYRIGTTNKVFIYTLVCKDTIDERVLEIVNDKQLISDYIIDDKVSPQFADRLKQMILELN